MTDRENIQFLQMLSCAGINYMKVVNVQDLLLEDIVVENLIVDKDTRVDVTFTFNPQTGNLLKVFARRG